MKEIRSAVEKPLVLHGGSGLSDDDFRNSINNGISKVNIFTDICVAGERAMAECAGKLSYLEARNKKVISMKEEVIKKINLFGSANKA